MNNRKPTRLTALYLIPQFSILTDPKAARAKVKKWSKTIPKNERLDLIMAGTGRDTEKTVPVFATIIRGNPMERIAIDKEFGIDRQDESESAFLKSYLNEIQKSHPNGITLAKFLEKAHKNGDVDFLRLLEGKACTAAHLLNAQMLGSIFHKKIAVICDNIFLQSFACKIIRTNEGLKKIADKKKVDYDKFFKAIKLVPGEVISIKELKSGGLSLEKHNLS